MGRKQLPEDFKDFINFLNDNDVCYLYIKRDRQEERRISS